MKLAAMFSDHAVLQRGRQVPVWGWTKAGLRVRVTLGEAKAETCAGTDGRFLTWLPPMPAGGPFTMEIQTPDPDERAVVPDVLVGEVWICSGQSNMEWTLCLSGRDGFREMTSAHHPRLRTIKIPRMVLPGRQSDVAAAWQVCSPDSAGAFTAVGYYFARMLQERLENVPVGLIDSSWGGTRIESWISREALVEDPQLRLELERCDATSNTPDYWAEVDPYDLRNEVQCQNYLQRKQGGYPADPGNLGVEQGWARTDFDDAAWSNLTLPAVWQNAGHEYSGVFWFRRQVDVPAAWAGKDLLLGIGAVDKIDVTYFNGEQVGATGQHFDQQYWNVPRVYRVPGRLVKAGLNVVAVRAYSFIYQGGLIGPKARMELRPEDVAEGAGVSLAGDWRYAVEHNLGQQMILLSDPIAGAVGKRSCC
ncbi:MAG: sialate O-acetylesterase [Kiritimatiellia bacterium]